MNSEDCEKTEDFQVKIVDFGLSTSHKVLNFE